MRTAALRGVVVLLLFMATGLATSRLSFLLLETKLEFLVDTSLNGLIFAMGLLVASLLLRRWLRYPTTIRRAIMSFMLLSASYPAVAWLIAIPVGYSRWIIDEGNTQRPDPAWWMVGTVTGCIAQALLYGLALRILTTRWHPFLLMIGVVAAAIQPLVWASDIPAVVKELCFAISVFCLPAIWLMLSSPGMAVPHDAPASTASDGTIS